MSLWQILLAAWLPAAIVAALRLGPLLRRLGDPGETTYETDLMALVQPENLTDAEIARRFAALTDPVEAEIDGRKAS